MAKRGFFYDVSDDVENNANVHRRIVERVERVTNRNLVCYYANPGHPGGALQDHDPDILENVIRSLDIEKHHGLLDLLIINSPGGFPYAAAKIVHVFRSLGNGFRVIVVNRALSAATLVCMGADELLMTQTASLGPIDPQVVRGTREGQRLVAAEVVIESFRQMLVGAQKAIAAKAPPDPFLHVLDGLDVIGVVEAMKAKDATKAVAMQLLSQGLLRSGSEEDRKRVVAYFMTEGEKELHGKHIYAKDLESPAVGMPVSLVQDPKLDTHLRELLVRVEAYAGKKGLAKYVLTRRGGIDVSVEVRRL